MVGDDRDRVQLGLEIKRDASGAMKAIVYQPVVNFYGLRASLFRDGDKYVIEELGATLILDDGKLKGSMTGLKLPMSLERTEKLPADPPVPDLPKGPAPIWQTRLGGAIYAPVTIRQGVAYVGTTSGIFNAVKVKDGKFAWTFNAGRPIFGGALVTSDAIFFVCDNGSLFRLDRKTGQEVYRYDLGDAGTPRILPHQIVYEWDNRSPQPVLVDGVIYVGSGDGSLHAVNAATGQRVWRFETKGKIRTDALVAGPVVITGSLDKALYGINRETGQQVWKRDTKGAVTGNPVLVGGKVVVGTRGSALMALNPADGDVAWRALYWGSWVESAAVPYGGLFYIGCPIFVA